MKFCVHLFHQHLLSNDRAPDPGLDTGVIVGNMSKLVCLYDAHGPYWEADIKLSTQLFNHDCDKGRGGKEQGGEGSLHLVWG